MEESAVHILLVEDDEDDAFLLRATLSEVKSGRFELVRAKRLDEAISLAKGARCDVALLDLSLPDSSGLETFVKLHQAAPRLPVVVLTGLDDETVAVAAVHEGAQDYLPKGKVDASLLVRSIRYAIERGRTTHYRSLLNERQRFDAAISQMSDAIVLTDGDWRMTNANRAAILLLNLPDDSWRGMLLEDALKPFSLSTSSEALQSSSGPVTAFEISRAETHPPLFLDARLSRLFDESGSLSSAVLMLRDVTDERLARHVQASLMTNLPHKLRTPLTVLGGYLDVAENLSPADLPRRFPRIAEVWRSELQQINDIVEKLLDFDALNLSHLDAELHPTDATGIAADAVVKARQRHPTQQVEVTIEKTTDIPMVDCTADRLGFILEELVDNAVKFGDKEPVRVTVKFSSDNPAWVVVTVTDNGPGIPHEYFDRIFEGFVQVEEYVTGRIPGLGIGLRLVKQAVEACGGTISVTSRIGEGSSFSFRLRAATMACVGEPCI